jgi:hypothetical protein
MALNIKRLDGLLQYILTVAGKSDGFDRELGMIHLIKYAYLADLSYARSHHGETYTGIAWTFHHFGPWSIECFKRIEPALKAINANSRTSESPKYDDSVRWSADDYELFDESNNKMDLVVAGAVQKYVRKFGNDTYGLLDFVYKTEPMLNAAPEELLDFKHAAISDSGSENEERKLELTARQQKMLRQKLSDFKVQLNKRLDEKVKSRKIAACPLPPRYDEVFFEGLTKLDEAAGTPPVEGEYLSIFTKDIWKSKARHDPELS